MYSVSKKSTFGGWRRFGLAAVLCTQLQHCPNALRDFGDKSSDAYLIRQAEDAMDAGDFDAAITAIGPVLESQPENAEVVYIASAAYAGRAGLRILDLLLAIPEGIDEAGLLLIFAEHFDSADDEDLADMATSVQILENFSDDATLRSGDMNFYALFLYYARIGAIINRYALDADDALVPTFTACDGNGLPDAEVDVIMTTLPRVIESAAAVAGGGAGVDSVVATDINALIGSSLPRTAYPCATAAGADQLVCQAVRTLVNRGKADNGIGIGAAGDAAGGACVP